jgi:rare lipoprotein A
MIALHETKSGESRWCEIALAGSEYEHSNVCIYDRYLLGWRLINVGGRRVSGERVIVFIAAHRTLPFGTILHVCLRRQCVSAVVKDRGPYFANMDIERRIDLSYGAAKALGMLNDGRQRVRVSAPMPMPRPEIETGTGLIQQAIRDRTKELRRTRLARESQAVPQKG